MWCTYCCTKCHVMLCVVIWCDVMFYSFHVMWWQCSIPSLRVTLSFSGSKRAKKRSKVAEEFSQKAADLASLEGYCRAAVHDFAPHETARKQFMYWGSKVPEAACLMLVQRYYVIITWHFMTFQVHHMTFIDITWHSMNLYDITWHSMNLYDIT